MLSLYLQSCEPQRIPVLEGGEYSIFESILERSYDPQRKPASLSFHPLHPSRGCLRGLAPSGRFVSVQSGSTWFPDRRPHQRGLRAPPAPRQCLCSDDSLLYGQPWARARSVASVVFGSV